MGASALEDDLGGVRVDVDVELRGRGDVPAFAESASHEDDLVDLGSDPGLLPEGGGDVGERGRRHQRYRVVGGADEGVDDKVDGMLFL